MRGASPACYPIAVKRTVPLALLLLAACAGGAPRPILVDEQDGGYRPSRENTAEEEKRARQELVAIERLVERGELPKIQFEFDKADITPDSYPTLDRIAILLAAHPRLHLYVMAHTDSVGSEEYNLDLSERRAKEVKGYLVRKGVPPPFVRYKGLGFSRPLQDNATDEGRTKNRRVEFRVTYRDWETVY